MKRVLLSVLVIVALLMVGCNTPSESVTPEQVPSPVKTEAEKEVATEEATDEETSSEEKASEEADTTKEEPAKEEATGEPPAEDKPAEETQPPKEPEPRPAIFSASNLKITQSTDENETTYTVTVDVKNSGDLKGTYSLVCKVDGEKMDTISVDLSSNQKKTITLTEAQAHISLMAKQYKKQEINDRTCKVNVGYTSKTVTFPELEYMLQLLSSKGTIWNESTLGLTGKVKNISGISMEDVEAVVDTYNSDGELISTESTPIYRNPLESDQISDFEIDVIVKVQDMKTYMVWFKFKSGEKIPTDYSQWNK